MRYAIAATAPKMKAIGLAPIAAAAPSVGTPDAPDSVAVPVGVADAEPVPVTERERVALEMVPLPEKLMEADAEAWVTVDGAAVVDMDLDSDLEEEEVEEEAAVEDAAEEVAETVLPERGKGPQ